MADLSRDLVNKFEAARVIEFRARVGELEIKLREAQANLVASLSLNEQYQARIAALEAELESAQARIAELEAEETPPVTIDEIKSAASIVLLEGDF